MGQPEADRESTREIWNLLEKPLIPLPSKTTLLLVRQTRGAALGWDRAPQAGAICHRLRLWPEETFPKPLATGLL